MNSNTSHRMSVLALGIFLGAGSLLRAETKNQETIDRTDAKSVIVAQRMKRIVSELSLTDEQKQKIRPLVVEEVGRIAVVQEDQSTSPLEKEAKRKEIRAAVDLKVKPILTAEQYEKWEQTLRSRPNKQPSSP